MNRETLHILIEKYFEGETTVEEERTLLEALLSYPPGDDEVDEALAVMGYTRQQQARQRVSRSRVFLKIASAAAILIIAVIGISVYFSETRLSASESCYAYIGGELIENEAVIDKIIASQLEEIGEVSDSVNLQIDNDLIDFRNIPDLETIRL